MVERARGAASTGAGVSISAGDVAIRDGGGTAGLATCYTCHPSVPLLRHVHGGIGDGLGSRALPTLLLCWSCNLLLAADLSEDLNVPMMLSCTPCV